MAVYLCDQEAALKLVTAIIMYLNSLLTFYHTNVVLWLATLFTILNSVVDSKLYSLAVCACWKIDGSFFLFSMWICEEDLH